MSEDGIGVEPLQIEKYVRAHRRGPIDHLIQRLFIFFGRVSGSSVQRPVLVEWRPDYVAAPRSDNFGQLGLGDSCAVQETGIPRLGVLESRAVHSSQDRSRAGISSHDSIVQRGEGRQPVTKITAMHG